MSWFGWLGLAVIITGVAAVTGLKPQGSRHVSHTSMMGVGRVVLVVAVLIVVYAVFRGRFGG